MFNPKHPELKMKLTIFSAKIGTKNLKFFLIPKLELKIENLFFNP